jgi:hypothetical protein
MILLYRVLLSAYPELKRVGSGRPVKMGFTPLEIV